MKKKRWLISSIIVVIVIAIVGIFLFRTLNDKNKLTSDERTWINTNINNLQNIYVVKDANIFSKNGEGVFYQFLAEFQKEYGLKVNAVNFDENTNSDSISLNYTKSIKDNDKVFYTDHYVLVSTENEIISNNSNLANKTIGVLNSDLEYIRTYLKDYNINYNGFDTIEDLFKAIPDTVNYIIVPRITYLDKILENNLKIIYHLSDVNTYYVLEGKDDTLSSILSKYFNKWEDNIDKYMKEQEFKIFTSSLKISDTEIDKLLSVDYNYGFVNNSPYEVIMSGKYGGIVAEYLQEFSAFSGVYFNITKYGNIDKLVRAINRDKVDIYFDFNNNFKTNYDKTSNGILSSISILTNKESDKIINSIYGLQGETVYAEENSNIYNYLKSIGNIDLQTYSKIEDLFKLNNEDVIIAMDSYIYDYYSNTKLNNYVSRVNTFINNKYDFKIKSNYKTLTLLLDNYMAYLDNSSMISKGINSHTETVANGSVLNTIAKYFILLISGVLIVGLVVYRNSKKIRIARRLKKDDKIRFIDELTCLKNRAYLSDFMKTWNNNAIYPQAIIVIDLNKLKEINDKYGVLEGDKQIQAAANALIKTQLDNSELMRSDGNEFVVYTVGYNQKQITNYIHKLSKELRKMPYEYGAEFGYSIIENNLKTIEDALNEAIEDMKNKKESGK